MKHSTVITAGFLAASATASTDCCHHLARALGPLLSYPGQASYNLTSAGYWSLQESSLQPACILGPSTSRDVAHAVSILAGHDGCRFAVKGQGHSPAAGFANVEGGVTIDMTGLAAVDVGRVDADGVVEVGAGASWLDVYRELDRLSVAAAGGRNGLVGVGGLLLGGGISHYSPRVGWACDTVVNFEIVLANGCLVNTNAHSRPDLYHALKGGANNLGVVTRFDLATFPQGNLSVTKLANDISQREAVFEAFTDIVAAPEFDEYVSLVTGLLFVSEEKEWQLSNSAVYTKPVLHPAVFDTLSSIPSTSNSSVLVSPADYADEDPTPPLNWWFGTLTFKPSAQLMMDMFNTMNETLYDFNPPGGVIWNIAYEPLAGAMTSQSRSNGGDMLGLGPENNGFIVLLSALWPDTSSNKAVNKVAHKLLSRLESQAASAGLLQNLQYLNYAAPHQKPFESYGEENYEFLKKTSKKYDPRGVFQRLVRGGFKLWW